jgi:hypothetical protein
MVVMQPAGGSPRWSTIVLVGVGAYLVGLAVASLRWHLYQDAPILLYAAYLIDRQHLVPYRDFFDMNMPGAYAANVIIGRLSHYVDERVRVVDLGLLLVLLGVTFVPMRRFGGRVATCAVLFFGAIYLASGEWMSLQREFLLLLPMAMALTVTTSRPAGVPIAGKAAAVGFLVGLAAMIKPQATLWLLPLVWYLIADSGARQPVRAIVLGTLAGFAIPCAAVFWYLARHGALAAFVDMAVNYWPLYDALSGARPHVILAGVARWQYIALHVAMFGIHPGLPLIAAAAIGAVVALARSSLSGDDRRFVWLLVALGACALLDVAVAGKFWLYHWLPFHYFAVLVASLGLMTQRADAPRTHLTATAALLLLLVALPWRVPPFVTPFRFPYENVQQVAVYLSARAQPGDTVLPLDWSEGALHAMLLARLPPATPFLYDFHMYHHVSSPYIGRLRRTLIDRLERTPPRFIVRINGPRYFAGPETATTFDELTRFMSERYERSVAVDDYEIWERRSSSSQSGWNTNH